MGTTAYLSMSSLEQEAKALARGLRSRDPELLDRLIEQYQYRLFRYLLCLTGRRETAEDLFQETWVKVLERGHQYDGKRKFEAWLFTIARNLTIDLGRRKKFSIDLEDVTEPSDVRAVLERAGAESSSPIDFVSQREEIEFIRAALSRLPAAHREVLVLRFQEDLTLDEIAVITAAPISTVKSRLYRSLEALRETLVGGQA